MCCSLVAVAALLLLLRQRSELNSTFHRKLVVMKLTQTAPNVKQLAMCEPASSMFEKLIIINKHEPTITTHVRRKAKQNDFISCHAL